LVGPHGLAVNEGNIMKKLIVATLSALVLVVGGSAAGVSAQADLAVSVAPDSVAPGETVTVTVTGADEGEAVTVVLGTETATGAVGADGTASVGIAAPAEPGEAVGGVQVGAVDTPFTVTVVAAEVEPEPEPEAPAEPEAAPEAAPEGDGTPQPTAVNTGDASSSSSNSAALFAAAAGLLVVGGGAMAIRRRSAMS
jgi:hypothetical protein